MDAMSQSWLSLESRGSKEPELRGIMIQITGSIMNEGNGHVCLSHNTRVDTAVADVSDLESLLAAGRQEANSIIRRLDADMKVCPQCRRQLTKGRGRLIGDDSDLDISLGT